MVERFNRGVNVAIAQRGKITDNSGKNTFHSHPEGNTYIINFVDAYNRTTLQCLNYRAPCSVLFDNHPEGNTLRGKDSAFAGMTLRRHGNNILQDFYSFKYSLIARRSS
jgi:hypothetical protein